MFYLYAYTGDCYSHGSQMVGQTNPMLSLRVNFGHLNSIIRGKKNPDWISCQGTRNSLLTFKTEMWENVPSLRCPLNKQSELYGWYWRCHQIRTLTMGEVVLQRLMYASATLIPTSIWRAVTELFISDSLAGELSRALHMTANAGSRLLSFWSTHHLRFMLQHATCLWETSSLSTFYL